MAEADTIPAVAAQESQPDPAMQDVAVLVQWRDAAEEASLDARKEAERDRDYYDNKQLTAAEIQTLKKRGQPIVIKNRIKRKIDFLSGLEKRQRANPKAIPRTPVEEQGAFAATDSISYVIDDQNYAAKRSQAWRNMLLEGAGGFSVAVEMKDYGPCVTVTRTPWDRMFFDPHSAEADFSDAMYLGIDVWMDETDAKTKYADVPDLDDILSATYRTEASQTDTYDDKPKSGVWADRSRKRIRITQMYFRPQGVWHYAEFTKGGLLKGGISPYQDEDGEPECEFLFQSAYVDRDNNRYGAVREMIGPQDEVNKRSSKALHLFTMRQIRIDPRAGLDANKTRKEVARADGVVEAAKDEFEILTTDNMAAGHFQLLQEAKADLEVQGPNADLQGDNKKSPSGKAIQLNQTGGLIELGDIMDGLRHLDVRVFRAVWNRIRQFWTEEKWIRVTDDERNIRFVGMNLSPESRVQLMSQYPEGLPPNLKALNQPISELDVDITIDAVTDSIEPQREQFQGMIELVQAGVQLPPQMLLESFPNLRNREKIMQMMEEQAQKPDPEQAKMQAEMQMKQMEAQSKLQMDQAELQRKREEGALEAQRKERELQMDLFFGQQQHQQKMIQSDQEHRQKMQQEREKAELQQAVLAQRADAQADAMKQKAKANGSRPAQ